MTASPQPTMRARQAALVAHALEDEDQRWLLQALQPAHRALLQPLLQELQALGLPRERDSVQDLLRSTGAVSHPAQALDAASAASLVARLAAEPPALCEWVLALRPWPWAGSLRAQCRLPASEGPSAVDAPDREAWLLARLATLATPPRMARLSPLARWVLAWRAGRSA